MQRDKYPKLKNYKSHGLKNDRQPIYIYKDTFGQVTPGQVNKWPNYMAAR